MTEKAAELAKELDEATREATRLLTSFVYEHCFPVEGWKPLPDLMGVLTQISNAVTVTRDIQAKADRNEALLKARIAGLEDEIQRLYEDLAGASL